MALNKINIDLLNSFGKNIDDPFLAFDQNGNIVFYNKPASRIFDLKEGVNIFDIMDEDTSSKINELLQNSIQNNRTVKEQMILGLNSGNEISAKLSLSPFSSEDDLLLLCIIKIQSYEAVINEVTNLQVKKDVSEVINNSKTLSTINEVKSSFPFTLISKERIRKLADEIDDFFWIKSTEGNYIFVNKNFASALGLSFNQIEGKNENTFVPTYLTNFHLLLDQYVIGSSNCVVVEGINLNGISNSERYQTIQIPLIDSENNTAAIICVGQRIKVDTNDSDLPQDENLQEKKLISKGKLFNDLINSNPNPILIVDKENLKLIDVNKSAQELYGYEKEELLNKDLIDLYSQDDIQTLLDSSVENLKEGIFYGPYKHKKKDGSIILVEISRTKTKIEDKDANLLIIKNVTEQVQLKKNNQIYKAAFENTSDLLFITDNSGFITFINGRVTEKIGFSKKELENTSFSSLLKDEERASVNNQIFKSQSIEPTNLNLGIKNSDGEFLKANTLFFPVFNYKKETESYLLIAKFDKAILENTLTGTGKKTEAFESVISKETDVDNSENGKQIPLSNIFHEILTPINVILGFIQELTENKEELTEEQKEAVEIINQNRVNLLHSMNSIVEYSNLISKKIEVNVEEIKITDVVDKLNKEFDELKGTREVGFAYGKISSSLKFKSDKNKFQHLCSLLLMLGIKMSKEEKIYFSAYQIDENKFAIVIKDNYGFTSDELLEGFNAIFEQDDYAARKNFGISKYTLKLINEYLHLLKTEKRILNKTDKNNIEYAFVFPLNLNSKFEEGKIDNERQEIEENENEETLEDKTFDKVNEKNNIHIEKENYSSANKEIIYEPETLVEESSKSSKELDISNLNCLYIEDQIDSQLLFKVQMKELKKIKFALTFESAIPMLEKERFDFILMDINLPGDYNGVDALKIIHKSPGFENIPIIAVSAYLPASEKEKFIAAGFSDFISKPLFKDKLTESLQNIF